MSVSAPVLRRIPRNTNLLTRITKQKVIVIEGTDYFFIRYRIILNCNIMHVIVYRNSEKE